MNDDKDKYKNPHLDEESPNEGLEHVWETELAEGGIFDQLTEQIGQGMVETFTKDKAQSVEPEKEAADRDTWNSLADEFSPESANDNLEPEKDMDMEER